MIRIEDEQDYLIHLIYCSIHGKEPIEIPKSLSIKKVFEHAKRHEVAQLAYDAASIVLDSNMLKLWKEAYMHAVVRETEQNTAYQEVMKAFNEADIQTLEVQGTVTKQYYPKPYLRMMSDIDIIIAKDTIDKAGKILQRLGYEIQKNEYKSQLDAKRGNIYFEFHTHYFDGSDKEEYELPEPFSEVPLTPLTMYKLHLLHTIKHLHNKGIGIRRIVDLYYIEERLKPKANIEEVDNTLKKAGLYNKKEKLIAISNYWFNDGPFPKGAEKIIEEIKASGNHGTQEILFKHEINARSDQSKIGYFLSLVFAPKERICMAYPECEGWPLIICWAYRIFKIVTVKEKRDYMKRFIKKLKDVKVKNK
mgnify:CR=1 FL=1